MLTTLILAVALSGTARCDAARREAIKAAEAAWMQEAPAPTIFTISCSCGDCTSDLVFHTPGYAPPRGSAYYECKLAEAQAREAAQTEAEQARREAEARVEAAKEAMYRVRDACGEGPVRPVQNSHLGRSVVHEPVVLVPSGGLDGR